MGACFKIKLHPSHSRFLSLCSDTPVANIHAKDIMFADAIYTQRLVRLHAGTAKADKHKVATY